MLEFYIKNWLLPLPPAGGCFIIPASFLHGKQKQFAFTLQKTKTQKKKLTKYIPFKLNTFQVQLLKNVCDYCNEAVCLVGCAALGKCEFRQLIKNLLFGYIDVVNTQ